MILPQLICHSPELHMAHMTWYRWSQPGTASSCRRWDANNSEFLRIRWTLEARNMRKMMRLLWWCVDVLECVALCKRTYHKYCISMCIYIYTYIRHIYIYTHTLLHDVHTYIHTYIHTSIHPYIHTLHYISFHYITLHTNHTYIHIPVLYTYTYTSGFGVKASLIPRHPRTVIPWKGRIAVGHVRKQPKTLLVGGYIWLYIYMGYIWLNYKTIWNRWLYY